MHWLKDPACGGTGVGAGGISSFQRGNYCIKRGMFKAQVFCTFGIVFELIMKSLDLHLGLEHTSLPLLQLRVPRHRFPSGGCQCRAGAQSQARMATEPHPPVLMQRRAHPHSFRGTWLLPTGKGLGFPSREGSLPVGREQPQEFHVNKE